MNARQLEKLGIPTDCIPTAIQTIQTMIGQNGFRGKEVKSILLNLIDSPASMVDDTDWGALAKLVLESRQLDSSLPTKGIEYPTWGEDIDPGAHAQMEIACRLPSVFRAALMPDAHVGYGLPIGGVLAVENAVIPYAVGVDIACRMKLSVLDMPSSDLELQPHRFENALQRGTRFGVGSTHETPQDHLVMDQDWSVTRCTREKKDIARKQLGTSGSGNHFVEFGTLTLAHASSELGLPAGSYSALLSHSGSRGSGASVCSSKPLTRQGMLGSDGDRARCLLSRSNHSGNRR